MPVEITMPLSPALQAVADARENVRQLGYKVEDLKVALKATKGAWEEAVEKMNKTLDEMIEGEKHPNLFSDLDGDDGAGESGSGAGGGPENPNPPAPAGQPADGGEPLGDPIVTTAAVDDVKVEVVNLLQLNPPTVDVEALAGLPRWRAAAVAEHIDGPGSLFDTLDLFNVNTMGDLANTLLAGNTFNLDAQQVNGLRDAIEDVSQEDERPIKFDRSEPVAVTVKKQAAKENDPGEEWEDILDKRQQQASDEEAARSAPEPEPTKPTKKGRSGRKRKEKEQAGQSAAVEPVVASEPVEADPIEPEAAPAGKPGYDEL
jgi:hypothetical protein